MDEVWFVQYENLFKRLRRMVDEGAGNSYEGDSIRNAMLKLWVAMDPEQIKRARAFPIIQRSDYKQ